MVRQPGAGGPVPLGGKDQAMFPRRQVERALFQQAGVFQESQDAGFPVPGVIHFDSHPQVVAGVDDGLPGGEKPQQVAVGPGRVTREWPG